jgi:hypothetical protein
LISAAQYRRPSQCWLIAQLKRSIHTRHFVQLPLATPQIDPYKVIAAVDPKWMSMDSPDE